MLSPYLAGWAERVLQRSTPWRWQWVEAVRNKEWEKLAAQLDVCLEMAPGKLQCAFQCGDWLRPPVSSGVALISVCAHQQLRHTWVAQIN